MNNRVSRIAAIILEEKIKKVAYVPRFRRERRGRGTTKFERRMYYRKNKPEIKRRNKIYRKRFKMQLKQRRSKPHFKRV